MKKLIDIFTIRNITKPESLPEPLKEEFESEYLAMFALQNIGNHFTAEQSEEENEALNCEYAIDRKFKFIWD